MHLSACRAFPCIQLTTMLMAAAVCAVAVAGTAPEFPWPCQQRIDGLDLDGSMQDTAWRPVEPLIGLSNIATGESEKKAAETELRICYDDTTLYILTTCREPNVEQIQSNMQEAAYPEILKDDCVELFFPAADGGYHIVGSVSGAVYDAKIASDGSADASWDSATRTGVQIFKRAYGVEFAIPIQTIDVDPTPGAIVHFDVRRHKQPTAEVFCLMSDDKDFPDPQADSAEMKLQDAPAWVEDFTPVKPRAGLRYSADDIANAHENIKRFDWALAQAAAVVNEADRFLEKRVDYYLDHLPPAGATFAYGFAGCPKCNARWGRFGAGMCSFENPGKIVCPECGTQFPSDDPESPYYDPGTGVEIDGTMYYFTGVWNAWVINQYKDQLDAMAHAYALTGDEQYAARAARIYDAMATLAPTTVGPIDNMRPHQKVVGRFHYYTQQWTEWLKDYLLYYDLLYHSEAMEQVSPTNPTGFATTVDYTVRENIEKNIFLDTWDVEMNTREGRLRNLHNHTSATVRAMLGIGLVCGEPDLVRWGIEAAYKFIYNTIDPEGHYYETSGSGYLEYGRRCDVAFAELLRAYDPSIYENPEQFPQPEDYPYDLKLHDHPRIRLLDGAVYEMDCAGHRPRYGDGGGDTEVVDDPIGQWKTIRARWAFKLFCNTDDNQERRRLYRKLQAATRGEVGNWLGQRTDALFWFRPLQDPPEYDPEITYNLDRSSLWGLKATSILRDNRPGDRLALLMRGGAIYPHGNDDTLHIALYSQGQPLNHEVAYDLYGRPIHYGWGTRSIAHPTVTVDKRGGPPLYRQGPNADVTGYAEGRVFKFIAMSTDSEHWGNQPEVQQYDRACALVTLPGGGGYFTDLFDVRGGGIHDYSIHGQTTDEGEGFTVSGADLTSVDDVWTLAGLFGHSDATYDKPGQSWGERVLPGNRIRDLGIEGEDVGYFGWWPPPKNGYGFIYDVKTAPVSGQVTLDWITQKAEDIHLRMHLMPGADSTLITGKGPDLTGREVIPFAVARREGEDLSSSFLAVAEGYTNAPKVQSVTGGPELDGMRGLVVESAGDVVDHLWSDTDGRAAFVRTTEGTISHVSLCGTTAVEHEGVGLRVESSHLEGEINSVDYEGHSFSTDLQVPNPSALEGGMLYVSNPNYTCNSGHRIVSCDSNGSFDFGMVGFGLSMADFTKEESEDRLYSSIPQPLAYSAGPTRVLDGRLARTMDGERTGHIETFMDRDSFRFKPDTEIQQGEKFIIYTIQAGDTVTLPMSATLTRLDEAEWELTGTCGVMVSLPVETLQYQNADGGWTEAAEADGDFMIPASALSDGTTLLRSQ